MTPRRFAYRISIVSLIIFSIFQVYVIQALAARGSSSAAAYADAEPAPLQTTMGRLRTRNNQMVQVNGINVSTGATIMSGATVETPDGIGATISLGDWGSIDIAPNSKILVEFSAGKIKITILTGCAIVRTKAGTYGEVYTEKGLATHNDPVTKPAAVLDVCFPSGAPDPIVNQGAAANAGAGAGAEETDRAVAGWIWLGVLGGAGGVIGLVAAGGGGGGGGTDTSNPFP